MSSVVTILASRAGLRYVTPVTRVPSFTRRVRAASPPSSVYASSIGCVGPPSGGSCQKWSMTQTESKPACSPATARSATCSNISRSGTSANVKFGIWRPNLVIAASFRGIVPVPRGQVPAAALMAASAAVFVASLAPLATLAIFGMRPGCLAK